MLARPGHIHWSKGSKLLFMRQGNEFGGFKGYYIVSVLTLISKLYPSNLGFNGSPLHFTDRGQWTVPHTLTMQERCAVLAFSVLGQVQATFALWKPVFQDNKVVFPTRIQMCSFLYKQCLTRCPVRICKAFLVEFQ